jgi:membrane-associated phospholipid phosphatase
VASQTRGRRRVWLWGLAAVGPLGMAATRVGAGRHFYSDVLTGALVGGLLGGLVPLVHPRRPEGARVARPALCGG